MGLSTHVSLYNLGLQYGVTPYLYALGTAVVDQRKLERRASTVSCIRTDMATQLCDYPDTAVCTQL